MLTGINKKVKFMIGILVASSLFIMISSHIDNPAFLIFFTMFTQSLFNLFFGYMLVIGCYIFLRKYENEFTIKDIGTLAFVSFLLMILCFVISNPVMTTGEDQTYNLMNWIYLIDILFVCAFFICKKQYHISMFPLFVGYGFLTIGFSFLLKISINIMCVHFLNAWMQLSMLFWVESLINEKTYQWYEWIGFIGMTFVMGAVCGFCGNMYLMIPLIHLCLLLYVSLMKTFVPIKQVQIYAVITLFIILIGLQFVKSEDWDILRLVAVSAMQIYLFIMSVIILLIEHQYPWKILACNMLAITVILPMTYDKIYHLDLVGYAMQVMSIGVLAWMYKKQIKWTYILFACIVCLVVMTLVQLALRSKVL